LTHPIASRARRSCSINLEDITRITISARSLDKVQHARLGLQASRSFLLDSDIHLLRNQHRRHTQVLAGSVIRTRSSTAAPSRDGRSFRSSGDLTKRRPFLTDEGVL